MLANVTAMKAKIDQAYGDDKGINTTHNCCFRFDLFLVLVRCTSTSTSVCVSVSASVVVVVF